jgi:outer membrane protein
LGHYRISKSLRGALLGVMCLTTPVAASAESLTDALILAYKHSHLLDQNRAVLRAADEDVASALAGLRPVIQFVAQSTYTPTSAAGTDDLSSALSVSADMMLFDNGATKLSIDVAKETVLATREALAAVEQQVLLSAVEAYLAVTSAIESVSLRENNVRVISQELRAARDRFEVGEVTRTDVALAEARLAGARSSLAAATGSLAVARERYRVAVGQYPGTLNRTSRAPGLPKTLIEAENVGLRSHPNILQAQRQVTINELNIARAQAATRFRVTAGANLGVDQDLNDSFSVTTRLTQPIYSGGALSSAIRKAKANRDASRANLLGTTHSIRQQVGVAWSNLIVAGAQLEATERQIRASRIAFQGIQEEAKLGSRTTLDVLDAEQELLDALGSRIDAQAEQSVANYSLLSSMGLLTVKHLGLGVQTYDPEAYYNAVKSGPLAKSKQGRQLDKLMERLSKQ